jgi:uncharacterized membrane protein YukC
MNKDEVITEVANDILNRLNIGQIVNVLREFSMQQATEHYESLSDDQRLDLTERIEKSIEDRNQKRNEQEEEATNVPEPVPA